MRGKTNNSQHITKIQKCIKIIFSSFLFSMIMDYFWMEKKKIFNYFIEKGAISLSVPESFNFVDWENLGVKKLGEGVDSL